MSTYNPATHKVVPKDSTVFGWLEPLSVAERLRECHKLTCRDIADAIESQHRPPRIPEPGLFGVVKAHIGAGGPWTLTRSDYGWVCLDDGAVWAWETLIDPTLVRPGIEDES